MDDAHVCVLGGVICAKKNLISFSFFLQPFLVDVLLKYISVSH